MLEDIEDVIPDSSTEEDHGSDPGEWDEGQDMLDDDGETTAEDDAEDEDPDAEDEADEDGDEADEDDPDAPRIPRSRLNEAVAKEREKRDKALEKAGLRWDEALQDAVPIETENAEAEASTDFTEGEQAWFDLDADDMAEDAGWRQVADWYAKQGIRYDLDSMSTNEAAMFKQQYRAHVVQVRQAEAGAEKQAADNVLAYYEGLDQRPELTGLDGDTVQAVKDDFTVVMREQARKQGRSARAVEGYTDAALGLAVLKNLDKIIAARGGQAVKAEKTRTRAINAQGKAPAPAAKKAATALTAQQREIARAFGMTPEQYAANMGD